MKIYDEFEQRSEEWHAVRMGVATASEFKRIMGNRGGDITYMGELIAQKLTGQSKDLYMGGSMEHGVEIELQAIAAYEFENNVDVRQVAFVKKSEFIGCSPDGLVGDDGLIEIKCPDTGTHIKWDILGGIPKDHIYQVLGSLWVTERAWIDFVSFDPRLDNKNRLKIIRIYAKDVKKELEAIAEKVTAFTEKMTLCLKEFE